MRATRSVVTSRRDDGSVSVHELQPDPAMFPLYRAVREFDRCHAARRFEAGSCSHGGMRIPKKEAEEELPIGGYNSVVFASIIGPKDFIPDTFVDAINTIVCTCTAREEEELQKRQRRGKDIGALLLEQGVVSEHATQAKAKE